MSALNLLIEPAAPARPRAASLLKTARAKLAVAWLALERQGQPRAARELALTADRIETSRPELAAQLRALVRAAQTD